MIEVGPESIFEHSTIKFQGAGNRVVVGCGARFRGVMAVSGGGTIRIGDGSTFGRADLVAHAATISIGDDAMFAHHIEVRTTDRHAIYDIASGARINPDAGVEIGDHVWVGKGSTILKGAVIERGAVVALASIVSGRVAANSVVAGTPARKIRDGIVWTRFEGNGRWQDDEDARRCVGEEP